MQQSFQQIQGDLELADHKTGNKGNNNLSRAPINKQGLHQVDSDQEERPRTDLISHEPFGNFLLFRQMSPHLSLGPDYWCFLPAFIAFSTVTYFLIQLVFSTTENFYFHVATVFIGVGQCLSYLLVALSDPGVVVQSVGPEERNARNCNKCSMNVPRHARHCNYCNVCISNYDHHCPWTSKCIGGGNIIRFYVFLGWTPIYLIYITVSFVVCMSANLVRIQQLPKLL